MKKLAIAAVSVAVGALGIAGVAFATPVSCSIQFTPSTTTPGSFQLVTGTIVGNVANGSFTSNLYVQPGNNTFTLTLPSGAQCKGTVVGQ